MYLNQLEINVNFVGGQKFKGNTKIQLITIVDN